MDSTVVSMSVQSTPDELSLCGPEVRAVFEGSGGWMVGTATMAQLSLDVRRLTEAVKELVAALAAKGD